ncbi:FAD-binding domain-containing protein [Trichodelitschia bisporula]|uniref:FAD-binding domain-containing protein n=1 Tax=Trichodelitschia bisporula TaxID=703511 RepID=A0A6G1HJI3_9PEZI|nr:FAD-binding domain-containing protein [Trichodelitschia bisporula]
MAPSLVFASVSLFILSLSTQGFAASSCKAIPGSESWPSDSEWAELNTLVGGRLSKPPPPAAVCHRNHPAYDESQCSDVTSGWRTTSWHAKQPMSTMWQNYNNYSCLPDPTTPCSGDGYPVYVLDAKTPEDIKAVIDFARTKKVRINIKNTGHDFLGRSTNPKSLSIWTHNLKSQKWFETSFTPKGCNFQIQGPAVTVGSGAQWSEVNSKARERSLAVVAGASTTVGVGGYIAGGGHGPLSAKFGLAADNVLEIEAVTASGEIITANECQNQDLFWALRGGGGSTFAVVTTYTMKAFPSVPVARWIGRVSGWDALTHMHVNWGKMAAQGASGYLNGYPGRGSGSASMTMNMPNATATTLHRYLDPIITNIEGITGRRGSGDDDEGSGSGSRGGSSNRDDENRRLAKRTNLITGVYQDFASVHDFLDATTFNREEGVGQVFPGTGSNKIITSWLWSEKAVAHPNLRQALMGAFDSDTQLLNDLTAGVGTANPPFIRGGGNAVNPAWRTAIMRPAAELQWSGSDKVKLAKRKADALKFGASLASVDPEGGTYLNEADPDTPNWQHAFWGSNYPRLLEIKRTRDPEGVFWCKACVGSEYWDVSAEGQLCPKGDIPAMDTPSVAPEAQEPAAPEAPVSAPEPPANIPETPVSEEAPASAPQPPVGVPEVDPLGPIGPTVPTVA